MVRYQEGIHFFFEFRKVVDDDFPHHIVRSEQGKGHFGAIWRKRERGRACAGSGAKHDGVCLTTVRLA